MRKIFKLQTAFSTVFATGVFAGSVLVSILAGFSHAKAANIPMSVKPGQISMPFHSGSVSGGQSGADFSLLGIKEVPMNGGGLQIVLSYGDHMGHPFKGEPGYFHVAIDRSGKRISMDLAQVSRTAIDQKDLARVLSLSKMIGASDITTDPHDGSTNITLNLRHAVNLKVRSTGGDQAKLILELQPFEVVTK